MSLRFTCRCGQQLAVPAEQRGKRVRCPRCQQALLIPAAPAVARPAPLPVPPPSPPVPQPCHRLFFAVAGIVLLLAAGGGVFLYQHSRRGDESPGTESSNTNLPDNRKPSPRKPLPQKPPSRKPARKVKELATLYPVDGQKDVPLSFPGVEVPDPIPEAKHKAAGYPITATFPATLSVRQATGRLTDGAGKAMPAWFSSPEKLANPDFARQQANSLCLIARAVLRPGTTYTVTMKARLGNKAWSRTWSFTTITRKRQTAGISERMLARVNALRRKVGLKALVLDKALSKASQAHADYLLRNFERLDRRDFNPNDEDPKLPGYSAAGKKVAEEAYIGVGPFDPLVMVENWLSSFQSRFLVLETAARKVGFGCVRGPSKWIAVVSLKVEDDDTRRPPLLYPTDGQKDVPLFYEPGETPDPIPDSKDRKAGFPITVMFPDGVAVKGVKAELRKGGAAVPFWMTTPEKPVAKDFQHNAVCLIARHPLRPASAYTVKVTAKVAGKPWQKTWTFWTMRDEPEDHRKVIAKAVAAVNAYRRLAGLAPVVLDGELSKGCLAHARYLRRNSNHPSTRGLGLHNEDPKLPGYTLKGARAGKNAVVATGMPPATAVEGWMATFYHRIPLLNPALRRVGCSFVAGGPRGWIIVMDVNPKR